MHNEVQVGDLNCSDNSFRLKIINMIFSLGQHNVCPQDHGKIFFKALFDLPSIKMLKDEMLLVGIKCYVNSLAIFFRKNQKALKHILSERRHLVLSTLH